MAYPPRKQSEGNVYHVIARGVGQQIIFEDDEDRSLFMGFLERFCRKSNVAIWAWCLMENHVHLLLHGPIDEISSTMQNVQSSYAIRFNKRHTRKGSLFQGRFTSIPIESDAQLATVVRYIHLNPVKSGGSLASPWSSYRRFTGSSAVDPEAAELIFELFGGKEGFVAAHEVAAGAFASALQGVRPKDRDALQLAQAVISPMRIYDIRALSKTERNAYIARMKEAGLSVRQIARLTTIGQNIIARV